METQRTWPWLVPLLLLLVALTLPEMNTSLWTDEHRSMWYAGAVPQYGPVPVTTLITRIADNLWQAPLYYLLLSGWGGLVGWSEYALRVMSLFIGLLAVAGVYRLGRVYLLPQVGGYAALTMGVGAFFINYLHDMRTYTLIVALVVVMLWAYAWVMSARPRYRVGYIVLTLSVAALLYSHYFAVFAVAALGLYHLVFRFRQPRFWQMLACFVIGGALFLPWSPVLIEGARLSTHDARGIDNLSPWTIVNNALYMFSNGSQALILLLMLVSLRRTDRIARFVWFWVIASIGLVVVVSRFFPALTEIRYLLFVWPGLALIVGIGIHELGQNRLVRVGLVALWVLVGVWNVFSFEEQERIHSQDYTPPLRQFTDELRGRTGPDDTAMFHLPPLTPFANEPDMMNFYVEGVDLMRVRLIPDNYATSDALYEEYIMDAIDGAHRVWLGYESGRYNWRVGPVQEDLLPREGFHYCGRVTETEDVYLTLWARERGTDDVQAYPFQVERAGDVRLYALSEPTIKEETLSASLAWEVADEVFFGSYSMGMHLEDAAGELVAQIDAGLTPEFGCLAAELPLTDLPPGSYTARLTVYNWETGERVPFAEGEGERPVLFEFERE